MKEAFASLDVRRNAVLGSREFRRCLRLCLRIILVLAVPQALCGDDRIRWRRDMDEQRC